MIIYKKIVIHKQLAVISLFLLSSLFTVSAHDSHTHSAPWQACETKAKAEQCSYTNGAGDLFKGSCQLFSESLMCVRNEPIIYAKTEAVVTTKSGSSAIISSPSNDSKTSTHVKNSVSKGE
ncbi:hypothetical protein [Colwellia echini]|uniref:DUF3551 domain-containing protein n=1 Tax=Colwellia echini TaxID=1982103 RepID=A0ABY3MV71_9GAMM|nr:hypothetical protein [Colwellia echini]TYK65113.1 hypothetical protein CWS31_012540 [Colwellia echini]